jgi:hypothetical protein
VEVSFRLRLSRPRSDPAAAYASLLEMVAEMAGLFRRTDGHWKSISGGLQA